MRSSGRRAPGLKAALKKYFVTDKQKRKELKEKKKRKTDKVSLNGYGGGTIIRTSHIVSTRYSRIRCLR